MTTPTSRRSVRCVGCGKPITKNNLRTHVYAKHPESRARRLGELYVELGSAWSPPAKIPAELERIPPSAELDRTKEEASARAAPALPPLEVDDVVLAVVENLADPSGLLPVAHLAAVFAWRDATATFLRSVAERP